MHSSDKLQSKPPAQQNSAAGCLGCLSLFFVVCIIFGFFNSGWWVLAFFLSILIVAAQSSSSSSNTSSSSSNTSSSNTLSSNSTISPSVPDDIDNILKLLVTGEIKDYVTEKNFSPGEKVHFCRLHRLAYHEDSWRDIGCKCTLCGNAVHTGFYTLPVPIEINEERNQKFPPSPTSNEQWFIAASDQQFGPYDLSTIQSMIASRQINPYECLSWKEGMENWLPFMEIPDLLALVQVSQPPEQVAPPPLPAKPAPPSPPPQRLTSLDELLVTTPPNLKESNERVEAGRVDLNNASLDDLLTLTGISLASGERLIRERDVRIGFETVEQVGHFLELQPHQIEKLKRKAVLNRYKGQVSKQATSARNRVIDF